MEWNKGVVVEREEEEDGEKGGIVARKRRAAPRGILRRVTHARRICVQDGKDRRTCLCILIASCKRNGSFDPMETNKRLNNTEYRVTNSCIALRLFECIKKFLSLNH